MVRFGVGAPAGRGSARRRATALPTASGVSSSRSRARGLGLSRKPDASGATSPSLGIMTAPEIFRFFGRIPNSSSICKVQIYERYRKISERAYSGKLSDALGLGLRAGLGGRGG
jgi:hypothetical protein